MEKQTKVKESIHSEILKNLSEKEKDLPKLDYYKIPREGSFALAKAQRNLFTDFEERNSGKYIISGLEKYVKEVDFSAFTFAMHQILYNQSYLFKNTETNSGVYSYKSEMKDNLGNAVYSGYVITSLNNIIRLGYGVEPTTELKKKMSTLIELLHHRPITIKCLNVEENQKTLCSIVEKSTRDKDGAVEYHLFLHPIFTIHIKNQYGLLPQNIMALLTKAVKRKTPGHYQLLRWLSVQDKRYSHTLKIGTLIEDFGMEEYYRDSRGKAEKQVLSICDSMKKIGILEEYKANYKEAGKRKVLISIEFFLNKKFVKGKKSLEEKSPSDDTPSDEPIYQDKQ